jgi:hypothetical protein
MDRFLDGIDVSKLKRVSRYLRASRFPRTFPAK